MTAVVALCLVLTPVSLASASSFTWSGGSTTTEDWSEGENWEGLSPPKASSGIGTLSFPRLTSFACEDERHYHPCYFSENDIGGLSAESLQIDDGEDYEIWGDELTLGSGGISATPGAAASEATGDIVEMPLHLGSSQAWSVVGRGDSAFAYSNLLLAGNLTGAGSALTVGISEGAGFYLAEDNTEVGPVKIEGTDTGKAAVLNGFVSFIGADLNSSDGQPVELSHILFEGSGEVGPLQTNDAEVYVGSGAEPADGIDATSATLDPASDLGFEISAAGTQAQEAYSQLISGGAVELNDAAIEVVVHPPKQGDACPALTSGQTYTFVSTTGKLSGLFADASADGDEIPLRFAEACSPTTQTLRIGYRKSGVTHTVTGTVEDAATTKQEEEAATRRHEEEAAQQHVEELAEQHAEEVAKQHAAEVAKQHEEEAAAAAQKLKEEEAATAAAKARQESEAVAAASKKQQEEEAAAATAKKHQEEEAAKSGVLGAKEGSPDASIASTSLHASASGAVTIKVTCPAGVSSCAGTVTLRTLNAVNASVAGAAKSKGSVLTLASGSFNVPGGGVKTVTLHLSAKARALLARLHVLRVRATIIAHDPAGGAHTGQTVATLRAAKSKHGKG
jgi:hypothetical protein